MDFNYHVECSEKSKKTESKINSICNLSRIQETKCNEYRKSSYALISKSVPIMLCLQKGKHLLMKFKLGSSQISE